MNYAKQKYVVYTEQWKFPLLAFLTFFLCKKDGQMDAKCQVL